MKTPRPLPGCPRLSRAQAQTLEALQRPDLDDDIPNGWERDPMGEAMLEASRTPTWCRPAPGTGSGEDPPPPLDPDKP